VIQPRTGCSRLETAQGQSVMTAGVGKLGILARVVRGGTIRVGDEVRVLEAVKEG
jgi:MOSC domain-containing protein YiiM